MKYFIVDVFCREKYSGNQLAVVIQDKPLKDELMQNIAAEFHFSETTFVDPIQNSDGSWNVRIFTPKNEVPFAGHPTLGTSWVIRNEIEKSQINNVVLSVKAGSIPVSFDNETHTIRMKQLEPVFGSVHESAPIAEFLNISMNDIDTFFPIQEVSTGINFLMVPLKTLSAVKIASLNFPLYVRYFTGKEPLPVFIFCPETYEKENSINCRMFAEFFDIPEDPATGSANGCLAAWIVKHKYFGSNQIRVSVEQGYEIDRKSILYIKANLENGLYNIEVGGSVIKSAEGELA